MLYAKAELIVKQYETICNRKIVLYRGDNNVEIEFKIISDDYIIPEKAQAQIIIARPFAQSIFSKLATITDNAVVLTISGDMIDELDELGVYTFQIRLFSKDQEDQVTMPPCFDAIEVRDPIAMESSLINFAAVNYDTVGRADESLGEIFDGDAYNMTVWRDGDIISDVRMNKIEEALYAINHKAGTGGGGASSCYISSESPESILVNKGESLGVTIDFFSPNPGKGTLKIAINNVDALSKSINQGASTVTIPGNLFNKGVNTVTLYALDRVGQMSNSLIFEVRYGSLEIESTFDSNSAYDQGSSVRYYFTPTAVDTSVGLTFYMSIDGTVQEGVSCVSDARGYYTFPTNLSVDSHYCEAYVVDANGQYSNTLSFTLVIIDDTSLVVTSNIQTASVEEGTQLVLPFKVYMKNNISFITKMYIDDTLVNTGTCGLETSHYKTSSLTEGEYVVRLEVYNINETVSDSISWNVTITESLYTMLEPLSSGSAFLATAYNKTNSDEHKEVWAGTNQDGDIINADLVNFSFNSENGWVDDSLIISGDSYVEIPVAPLANNAKYGFTLDIEFLSKQIGVDDAEVLTLWNDEKNCGIKITTENLILRSAEGNECNLYFSDNEFTNAMFVIDRNELKAKIYLNGVMCEAFHLSDYVANGVSYLEDFSVNSNLVLGGLNKNGYCKIKNLRIYEVALSTSEILNNFISNKRDKTEQQALSEFQKGNDLPTMTIYCDFSGLGKDDKKPCDIVYISTDAEKYGESFTLEGSTCQLQYQGTSSMAYPIKNYRINLRDSDGEKWYYNFPFGKPECRFTLKADFMSSGHWQNTGFTKWVNDNLYNYNTSDEKSMNPKKWFDINNGGNIDDTRECIYGFPCRLILVNNGTTALNEGQNEPLPGNTKDMGIFNFNHDKDSTTTMGFDQDNFPNCASYEVAANSDTSAGAFMSYETINPSGMTELEYIKQSFELRFPDEDDVSEDWGFMGIEGEDGTGLKALIDWVDNSTDEEFVNDFEEHFNKDYTLRYYLMVIVCGMVDNLGKNMMLDTWDNKIFMPRFYDCDTICSYDNSGDIKFDVDIEMEQGYWNTSSSRLWTRIRDLMHDDLVEKYNNMRQNGLTYESMMACFYDEQIAKIPQKYYNMDYDVKYAPFQDSYIGMAHGNGYEHLKRWLKNRFIFCDTLFDYTPSYINDVLTIRANTTELMNIQIETYTPVYQHMSWYNGQMDKKKIDGKSSVSFSGTAMAATDQEVLIYGGSNIKKISGLNTMNPNQMLIGYATRMSEVTANDCPLLADINSDGANLSPHIYLNNINLSNCPSLSGILRLNNSQLIQNIDISGTSISGVQLPTSLRNLKIFKTSEDISNLTLRDAALLSELQIPTNVEYLSLINIPNLTKITSTATSFDKLNTLIMENPKVNPVSNIVGKAPNLQYVRLIGLDITCSVSHMQLLSNLKGIDSFGNEIPISQSISGKVTITQCSEDLEIQLKETFPLVEFTITSYAKSYTVTFVDGDGNVLYVTQALQNDTAIYVGDTPTKTSTKQYNYEWTGWDKPLKQITSDCTITATFEEILRYYTIRFIYTDTLEVLNEQVLPYGSAITKPTITNENYNSWTPTDATVTGDIDFYTTYVPYPDDLSIFTFTTATYNGVEGYDCKLNNSTTLPAYLIIPFEYEGKPVLSYGHTEFVVHSEVTEVYMPETVKFLATGAFYGFSSITELNLPNITKFILGDGNIMSYTNQQFGECSSLKSVKLPKLQELPSSSSDKGAFRSCTSLEYVWLGSEDYPFNTWRTGSTGSTYAHFYGSTDKMHFINLVTKNGIESDVTAVYAIYSSVYDKIKFTIAPIEVYSDDIFDYMIMGDEVKVITYNGTAPEVVIPNTVKGVDITELENSLFAKNTTITSVMVPTTVTSLGTECFRNCTNLTSIEIPNATTLGDSCFYGCSSLTSIEIPNATTLGNSCFRNCTNLTSIEIPNATTLGNSCFYGCSSLTSIEIPNITSLGSSSFYGCSSLNSITFGGVGKAITTTFSTETNSIQNSYVTSLNIYVTDPSNPPSLTNSPWGASNATITYEQA